MNTFFLNIQGLSSENLTTEILAAILSEETYSIHQKVFYNYLLRDNGNKSTLSRGFNITTQEIFADGRPDLIIKGTNEVYIIENKFYAYFTKNQLRRYLKILNTDYKELKNKKLFLLTINDRKQYYIKYLKDFSPEIEQYINIILWEEVLESIQANDFLIEALSSYIQEIYLTKVEFNKKELEMLNTHEIPQTIKKLQALIHKVRTILYNYGFQTGRMDSSYRYFGFYIHNETLQTWFGYGSDWWLKSEEIISPLFMQIRDVWNSNPPFDEDFEHKLKQMKFFSIKPDGWIKPYSSELFANNEELALKIKEDMEQLTKYILVRNKELKG